jgi:hypothetical protein
MIADPLAAQKRQIGSGCQTIGGCLAVIIICVVIVEMAPVLLRLWTAVPADGAIVFARPRHLAHQMIYMPIIMLVALTAIVACVKSANGRFIAVALALAAFGAIGFQTWFRTWTAIDFRDRKVHLHYLWPMPVSTIEPRDIVSVGEIRVQEPSATGSDFLYRLQIEAVSARYLSMANGAQSNITEAKARLRALNPKIAIRDAPLW